MEVKTCKGCGARIRFIKMESGKAMPVNADPIIVVLLDGDPVLLKRGTFISKDGETVSGAKISQLMRVFESHFATCPKHKDFRRDKR